MYGRLRIDDDGYWYVVPESEVAEFDKALGRFQRATPECDEWYAAWDAFARGFGRYRLNGWIGNLRVLMTGSE